MKVYEQQETVEGFKPCCKLPIIIKAVQINEPFRVNSLEGDYAQGNEGDYLMRGAFGEYYICKKEIFDATYYWVEETK